MPLSARKQPFNPFYVLLALVGFAFCVTAFAYGVMTVRGLHPDLAEPATASGQQFMEWLDVHGFRLLMSEVAALAACTVAAIATDNYWERGDRQGMIGNRSVQEGRASTREQES